MNRPLIETPSIIVDNDFTWNAIWPCRQRKKIWARSNIHDCRIRVDSICQFVGGAELTGLPVPGPVVGLGFVNRSNRQASSTKGAD